MAMTVTTNMAYNISSSRETVHIHDMYLFTNINRNVRDEKTLITPSLHYLAITSVM